MVNLFKRCLNAKYIPTENGGDYAIEIEGNTLYLLFQWSDEWEDWKNNFTFPVRSYKKGDNKWYCHSGFHRVWMSMRAQLEPRVNVALINNPNIDTITCVGFSHGGPMAGFATEDMEFIYGSCYNVQGYGFGCPRFIFGKLPKTVKNRFKNFTVIRNIPDIVTHVPPLIFGFRHGGKILKLGKLFNWKLKIIPIFRNCFRAHYPEEYIKEMEKQK